MSSISVGELMECLKAYPEDYEVIFEIREVDRETKERKRSLAYINGIKSKDDFREVYLMN